MTIRRAELARRLTCAALGSLPSQPNGLRAIANRLGARVRVAALPPGLHGQTVRTEDGHVVTVELRARHTRQRFTLAHELGHVMLDSAHIAKALGGDLPTDYAEVERLCDATAAELLMPTPWMLALKRRGLPSTLEQARGLAEATRVSLSAFTVRMNAFGSGAALLTLRGQGDVWTVTSHSGARPAPTWTDDFAFLSQVPNGLSSYEVEVGLMGGLTCRLEVDRFQARTVMWIHPLEPVLAPRQKGPQTKGSGSSRRDRPFVSIPSHG